MKILLLLFLGIIVGIACFHFTGYQETNNYLVYLRKVIHREEENH